MLVPPFHPDTTGAADITQQVCIGEKKADFACYVICNTHFLVSAHAALQRRCTVLVSKSFEALKASCLVIFLTTIPIPLGPLNATQLQSYNFS